MVNRLRQVEWAVEAMKRGAAEFLTKPVDLEVLSVAVDRVLGGFAGRRRLEQFQRPGGR